MSPPSAENAFRVLLHDMQELSEALTTTKSMVGRRLLECSDLSWEGCIEFWNPFGSNHRACHNIGFENECNNIVNGFKATWDAAKKTAVDAANAAKDVAVSAANEATALANAAKAAIEAELNKLKEAATGWVREITDEIRCATALLAALMTSRPNVVL
jgi:hypothetical protein